VCIKAGHLDHIWPVKLHLSYITKKKHLIPAFDGQFSPANFGQDQWLFQLRIAESFNVSLLMLSGVQQKPNNNFLERF